VITDLNRREAWVIAPVLGLVVALGIYPKPVLDVITPSVTRTVQQTGNTDPKPSIPVSACQPLTPNAQGLVTESCIVQTGVPK
jgi:NADH-quinone oxidoreductase subunit M